MKRILECGSFNALSRKVYEDCRCYPVSYTHLLETINMIDNENLDVRTITMGISLLDCIDPDIHKACDKIYDKICRYAGNLVKTGEDISAEYGIPIVNKRVSVTPISMVAGACPGKDPVQFALALDRAAKEIGVNFIGGYSALVHKGFSPGDYALIQSIPEALSRTDYVCSSVNIGTTKAGINMDAVDKMGTVVRQVAEATADRECIGAAKLVVFCNAPEDNPFMAGAFHGPGEPDCEINVGVSGPGVVRAALAKADDCDITEVANIVKKTAFKITRMGQLVAQEASRRPVSYTHLDVYKRQEQTHPVFGIIQLIAAERHSDLLRLLQNMFYDLILLYGKTLERIQKHPVSRKIILPLQDRIQAR